MEKVSEGLLQQDINEIRGYVRKYKLSTKVGSPSDEVCLRVLAMADKACIDAHNLYLAYDELLQKNMAQLTKDK